MAASICGRNRQSRLIAGFLTSWKVLRRRFPSLGIVVAEHTQRAEQNRRIQFPETVSPVAFAPLATNSRVAQIACNLGAEGMGGRFFVIDASNATSHRCATPVASNPGHPRLSTGLRPRIPAKA